MKKKFNWRAGLKHFAQFWGVVLLELVIIVVYVITNQMESLFGTDRLYRTAFFRVVMNTVWFGSLAEIDSNVLYVILKVMHYITTFIDSLLTLLLVIGFVMWCISYAMGSPIEGAVSIGEYLRESFLCIGANVVNFIDRHKVTKELVWRKKDKGSENEPA